MGDAPSLESVGLSGTELEWLLGHFVPQAVRATIDQAVKSDRRRQRRYPYHLPNGLMAETRRPDSSATACRLFPRNISTSGIGLIDGPYMPLGTKCWMLLVGRDGATRGIRGCVVRCDRVRGHVQEMGLEFTSGLDANSDDTGEARSPGYDRRAVVAICREIIELADAGAPGVELLVKVEALVTHCRSHSH